MATSTFTRQPFGDITSSRRQALGSSKNRQNALSPSSPSFACPLKPSAATPSGKRQREPDMFEDEDSENVAPAASSPPKKSRTSSDSVAKPARFALVASPTGSRAAPLTASPASSISSSRTSVSSPSTTRSTPISHSRGSPKNKRLSAISKRRSSTSPFRRVDPPSFSPAGLPFSIDAALSGTLAPSPQPSTPTLTVTPAPAPAPTPAAALDDSMPQAWFFAIHEDTPEQESANLMEHSASVLDISSDADAAQKAARDDAARGKENIPPPDFLLAQARSALVQTLDDGEETEIEDAKPIVKSKRRARRAAEAMDEDRRPLGDLPPADFYAAGCTAASYVTVDAGIERPSRLSKEVEIEVCADEDADENEVDTENTQPVKKPVAPLQPRSKALQRPTRASRQDHARPQSPPPPAQP
ncbi:hypothetical protein C7974DRAFT_125998 [Boeremia exigua]|uniref:uncharacterized protein n=1 Tax=Boeremia exigua TaxID=749465 RepID=UPI001E8CA1AD|nr:uncharacterized protein C7974DRAFT_125998 [Boeremia exigua]KAH6639075.1 hypothetical protein C7974DRAFT_125998 [Boeremia exigua]